MTKYMTELSNNSRCVFYFSNINKIGGVESFLWYLANLYDIEVYYKVGDAKQIERLAAKVPVHKYKNGTIKCDKAFFNYNPDIIDNIIANEYIGVIHCDYNKIPFKPCVHPKITKWVGVSKLACDSFKEITGITPELIYNPVVIDKEAPKPLIIVAATRLTFEKGKDNLITLANRLSATKKPYLLIVFTDDKDRKHEINNPNIVYADTQLDIAPYLKIADYVLVPSTTEAFGYTPVEAATLGIPLLLMDLPIWKELGFKDGVHGYIIKDINKFDLNKLYEKIPKFEYKPPKSNWNKYLPDKGLYDPNKLTQVKAIKDFDDMVSGKHRTYHEEFGTNYQRAIYLESLGLVEVI